MTEAEVLTLLRLRHCKSPNAASAEWAYMPHVRNSAGFNSTRTFDAVVMGLWPSRGLTLHAFEVKCSRSDWLREMKEPAKAEAAAKLCDRFSIVAADDTIVAEGELPLSWGLLVVRKGKLVCVKDAPLLPEAKPKASIPREFVVSLLRAGGAIPQAEAEEVRKARTEGYNQGVDSVRQDRDAAVELHRDLARKVSTFERSAGVSMVGWAADRDPKEVALALRTVLQGDKAAEQQTERIRQAQAGLRRAADDLDRFLS